MLVIFETEVFICLSPENEDHMEEVSEAEYDSDAITYEQAVKDVIFADIAVIQIHTVINEIASNCKFDKMKDS